VFTFVITQRRTSAAKTTAPERGGRAVVESVSVNQGASKMGSCDVGGDGAAGGFRSNLSAAIPAAAPATVPGTKAVSTALPVNILAAVLALTTGQTGPPLLTDLTRAVHHR